MIATPVLVCALSLAHCGPRTLRPVTVSEVQPTGTSAMPRVRSDSPAIVELIRQATQRSRTVNRLVAAIEHTDGIVYVAKGTCGHGVRNCLLLSMTVAGRYRILHIKVDPRKTGNELMAAIGHELQHAIEVLSNVSLTSNGAIYHFFERIGSTGLDRFETSAAIHAGWDVGSEMDAWAKSRGR